MEHRQLQWCAWERSEQPHTGGGCRLTDWPGRAISWPSLAGAANETRATMEDVQAPRSLRAISRRSRRCILCFSVLSGIPGTARWR